MLQEYFDQFYVEHYEEFGNEANKAAVLHNMKVSKNWIYKGKLGYVVDSEGYVHYFLIIENLPKEIRGQIKIGIGEKTYSDYANCNDVWGITEDLKIYYCKDGLNSIDGVSLANLGKENGNDTAFSAGSSFAQLLSGGDATKPISKNDLRSKDKLTIDNSYGISDLNELYNFVSLRDLTLKDLTLDNLDGIEYLAKVYRIYIIRCTIGDYSKLAEIAPQIQYLFFEDTNDAEIEKFCDSEIGVGGVDFANLAYFGIYGKTHFDIDYMYDEIKDEYNTNDVYHASFQNTSYLSNLSELTKKRVKNLFLNNNSIENIDNLYEFSGVERLRIEDNYIKTLNGLYKKVYNDTGDIVAEQWMKDLTFLYAYSNMLGYEEQTTNIDVSTDALNVFSNVTLNDLTSAYHFESRFPKLTSVYIQFNYIKWLNYFSNTTSLTKFSIISNSNLNLESGVQSMLPIFEKDTFKLDSDSYVSTYINENSKKVPIISLAGKTMTINEFSAFLYGRGLYLKKLTLTNLILKDDDGNIITNDSNPKFDSVVNECLSETASLEGLSCKNLNYLTSISFVRNMQNLNSIDLRGTGVTDLSYLVDYCSSSIAQVILDNENIPIAGELKEDGTRDITPVESLFNITYGNTLISSFKLMDGPGVSLMNSELIEELENSTNITKCYISYYGIGSECSWKYHEMLGSNQLLFDLRNTKITDLTLFSSPSSGGMKILLPTTIQRVKLRNTMIHDYFFDTTNLNTLINLTNVTSDNCGWSTFWDFASNLPKVSDINYYLATITSSYSLENYIDNLKKAPVTSLKIYGHGPYKHKSNCGQNELSYISQLTGLKTLKLYHLSGLTNADFVKNLNELETLDLSNTNITSLEFIETMNSLKYLTVENCTTLGNSFYNSSGEEKYNLNILKNKFNSSSVFRSVFIRGTSITSEEISSSGINSLAWTYFSHN